MPQLVELTQKSQHGTWIEVRLDRLRANLKTLKNFQRPGTEVMAVVKANAYGHGLLEIARALSDQVGYLGVASLREALELTEHRIGAPVFIFSPLLGHEIPTAVTEDITLSVSSFEEASEIAQISASLGKKTKIHIKVDTGMGRFGIPYSQALKKIEKMSGLAGIEMEGLFTHFPTAEAEDGFTERQIQDFAFLLESLEQKGITFRWRHAANSAASLKVRTPVFNMIRPGLMLYGIYPDPSLRDRASVLPILSLKSRLLSVKRFQPEETVGYGRRFVAKKPTTVGILAIGYSHGYPFRAWQKASVIYKDAKIPLAGRVSMDYLAVDLGDLPAHIGDEITLIGSHKNASITAEEVAGWAGTIPYEIVTSLISGIPRFYR